MWKTFIQTVADSVTNKHALFSQAHKHPCCIAAYTFMKMELCTDTIDLIDALKSEVKFIKVPDLWKK